jgi:2-methylcitrate dehydratase PrpD
VRTADGRTFTATVARPLGDPTRPMSRAALEAKFRDCCSYAPGLAARDVSGMIDFVDRIEETGDVSGLLPA